MDLTRALPSWLDLSLTATDDTLDLEAIEPDLGRLVGYWRGRGAAGRLPARGDIDPGPLRHLLPGITLIEVERDARGQPERFRVRLVGSRHYDVLGRDITGLYLDEHGLEDDGQAALAAYRDVAVTGQPHYRQGVFRRPGQRDVRFSRVLLPLAADGATVDMILAGFHYSNVGRMPGW
jgi:hypothetical protein